MDGDTLILPVVSLSTLVDSPLLAGEYFRSVSLSEGTASTRISIAADAPGDLAVSDATLAGLRHLVPEALALFGPGHYREYVWLVALADPLDRNGLEHHESTDIRDNEAYFTDPARLVEDRTSGARPGSAAYSRGDMVSGLRALAPLDWDAFLTDRVDRTTARAPLAGIERGGWRLTYDDTPNDFLSARDKVDGSDNLSLSLGLWSKPDGAVADVVHGSPAFAAGVAPSMRLVAIGGRKWSAEAARETLVKAEKSSEPIELIVQLADLVRVLRVDYHGGLRNPHLVRDGAKADLLSQILAPKASPSPPGR